MGAQRVQYLPDHLVFLVVIQRLVGRHARRNAYRQDDITHAFVGRLAHHPADCLHHVDLAVARVQEQDGIQRRHIHAFCQAACIAQDTADLSAGGFFQPIKTLAPGAGFVRPVHMFHFTSQINVILLCAVRLIRRNNLVKLFSDEF